MKNKIYHFIFASTLIISSCQAQTEIKQTNKSMSTKYNELSAQEQNVILNKATDRPFTGEYYLKSDEGIYLCRQCNNPLYTSEDKFEAHCGWPSFDKAIKGAVKQVPDADGSRVEIICNNCEGHLGHVFTGEKYTSENTRFCVNTSSLMFYPAAKKNELPAVIK